MLLKSKLFFFYSFFKVVAFELSIKLMVTLVIFSKFCWKSLMLQQLDICRNESAGPS